MTTAGYSGTPLARKLGIKDDHRICAIGSPLPYADLIAAAPERLTLVPAMNADTDLVHVFETRRAGLARHLEEFVANARPDAVLWVSWPKKASKVPSEITEDTIRELALPLGLVDVKVCAVNEVWSGLKLVWRVERRPQVRQARANRPR